MNLLKQHKIKYLHYLHFLPLFSSLSLWLGDTSFAHLNIQCSFVVIVHKAVIFLWEAKANIALAAQCGRISLNTVSAASSLGLPWEMCNHVFAYINWGVVQPLGWGARIAWGWPLLRMQRTPWCHRLCPWRWSPSLWCCVHQDERGCNLCLKLSPVQCLFLRHLQSFTVPLVEEPGVDHRKDDGVPEDVHVPAAGFHGNLYLAANESNKSTPPMYLL